VKDKLTPNQNNPIGSSADSIQAKYNLASGEEGSIARRNLLALSILLAEYVRYRAKIRS
jgi:hypothetical protein